MKLNIKNEILDDVITTTISVDSLGNANLSAETEAEYLADYVTTIQYSDIDFSENLKIDDSGIPVATEDEADESTVATISIKNLINKVYRLDADMVISFSIDTTKIPDSDLVAPFETKALMGQAYATVFADKIQETISEKLTSIRAMENSFEGDTEVIL